MIDDIDKLGLQAELVHTVCQLNHGSYDKENHQAVDYLVIPMGEDQGNDTTHSDAEMVIPICHECAEALQGDEWTLIYCLDCGKSHWVLRALSRLNYRHHIIWIKGCPECGSEFRGVYFSDEDEIVWDLAIHKKVA